jgi:hypothetical protein
LNFVARCKYAAERAEYRKVVACLHPDRSLSDKMLSDAFNVIKQHELVLVAEKVNRM